jgi:hypothetical protein
MAGYLDQYGAGEEGREKIVKRGMIALAVLAVALVFVGLPLYFAFHNSRQEGRVKQFFALLAAHNYPEAYVLWGCTDASPCKGYPFSSFLQDWGPEAMPAPNAAFVDGESCGTGVLVDVDTGQAGDKKLWVDRDSLAIGFSPFPDCPKRSRFSDFVRNVKYRLHGRSYK